MLFHLHLQNMWQNALSSILLILIKVRCDYRTYVVFAAHHNDLRLKLVVLIHIPLLIVCALIAPHKWDLADDSVAQQIVKMCPDLIMGGPPCQDYSIAGKRELGN